MQRVEINLFQSKEEGLPRISSNQSVNYVNPARSMVRRPPSDLPVKVLLSNIRLWKDPTTASNITPHYQPMGGKLFSNNILCNRASILPSQGHQSVPKFIKHLGTTIRIRFRSKIQLQFGGISMERRYNKGMVQRSENVAVQESYLLLLRILPSDHELARVREAELRSDGEERRGRCF